MELEELQNFKLTSLAKQIVQYQNFKTAAAISKMTTEYSKTSLTCYFAYGVKYLKTGDAKRLNPSLKEALDKCKAEHIQPLTPKDSERRIVHKSHVKKEHKKETTLPIQKLDIIGKPLVEKFEYGLRLDNKIMVVDSKKLDAFTEISKFFGLTHNIQTVKVSKDAD